MISVVAAVIVRDQQVLLSFRDNDQHQGGRWEFPGGKVEWGESNFEALKRELREELGIEIVAGFELATVDHQYIDKSIRLNFWQVTDFSGEPKSGEGQLIRWCAVNQLHRYQFPDANQTIVQRLADGI